MDLPAIKWGASAACVNTWFGVEKGFRIFEIGICRFTGFGFQRVGGLWLYSFKFQGSWILELESFGFQGLGSWVQEGL